MFAMRLKKELEIPQPLFVEIAEREEDGGFDAQNVRV